MFVRRREHGQDAADCVNRNPLLREPVQQLLHGRSQIDEAADSATRLRQVDSLLQRSVGGVGSSLGVKQQRLQRQAGNPEAYVVGPFCEFVNRVDDGKRRCDVGGRAAGEQDPGADQVRV